MDNSGRPVSQYPVKLESFSGLARQEYSAITDHSGTFVFLDVPPGNYLVQPINQPEVEGKTIAVRGEAFEDLGVLHLGTTIQIRLNPEAAATINKEALKTINPEAARTISPEAAKVINPEAAKTINPAAARVINPDAAATINAEAARVLNPERARVLKKDDARQLTVQQAQEPLRKD